MTESEPDAYVVVTQILSAGDAERLKSYLSRGRVFEGLSPSELEAAYVAATKRWADNPDQPHVEHSDLTAEFDLRQTQPPMELVKDDIARITKLISDRFWRLSSEEVDEIKADLMAEYDAIKSGEN